MLIVGGIVIGEFSKENNRVPFKFFLKELLNDSVFLILGIQFKNTENNS